MTMFPSPGAPLISTAGKYERNSALHGPRKSVQKQDHSTGQQHPRLDQDLATRKGFPQWILLPRMLPQRAKKCQHDEDKHRRRLEESLRHRDCTKHCTCIQTGLERMACKGLCPYKLSFCFCKHHKRGSLCVAWQTVERTMMKLDLVSFRIQYAGNPPSAKGLRTMLVDIRRCTQSRAFPKRRILFRRLVYRSHVFQRRLIIGFYFCQKPNWKLEHRQLELQMVYHGFLLVLGLQYAGIGHNSWVVRSAMSDNVSRSRATV